MGVGDDSGPGRLSLRFSRLSARRHSRAPSHPDRSAAPPPQRLAQQEDRVPLSNNVPPPVRAPAPAAAPHQVPSLALVSLAPATKIPPKRPDKSTKPKLPPRPLSKGFSSNEHSSNVLQGFNTFRASDVLCDVVLVPGDSQDTFPVHRVIMASSSDYFKAMFTGGMRETDMREIKLHGVTTLGLKNILDFIYTSKINLDMGNLQETLEAANFLQVIPVLSFCNQLLSSEITVDNCVEVECIASDLLLEDLQRNIAEFVSRNLSALVQCGRYLQLSKKTITGALASNSLNGLSEMELYQIAKAWVTHDSDKRRHSVYDLMRHIRFPLMSPSELIQISHEENVKDEESDSLMRSETSCINLLLEASNYQMMPFMQPGLQSERTQIRSDTTHIVALGGVMRQQLVVSRELRMYDNKTGHWRALKSMDVPCYQHGVALLGGFLFIVGGQSTYDTKGKTAIDSAYRYDPRFNVWLQIASLNEKRTFFHLSALKGKLYAVGGRNVAGEIDSVECYDLKTNEWRFVRSMAESHYGHAGTVHGDMMYISGGITHDTFQRELWCYDPARDTWTRRADMKELRGLHCMCTVGDRIFVMGGNHFRGSTDYDDVLACECYSPKIDQWTVVAPMPRGQSDVGVTVFQGQIYVVGGYSWNSRCMVDIVQRYDPEEDTWDHVFDILEPLGGIRACTMTVHLPEGSVDEVQIQEVPLTTGEN
ncbi:kelch-like protein 9 isoform X2 [Syngnathoides biaculeatus]|uniref:kelch-like protein 9 isoform X2 n=1 Tax=Syngnathoides biaculeatus TaxID=300417 RepID=UPI002ADE8870|nr:kelch-like protein 9 isoform X2 [Syngnathoides biaculeatus]XP_061697047.1 kelch-like protein 9 isoform X2 [Syngnathoides biaculeatus]